MPQSWRRLLAPRDRELTDAGAAGELVVARSRLVLSALLFVLPIGNILEGEAGPETWLGFTGVAIAVVVSVIVLIAVSRGFRPAWLGLATSLFDVSIITCLLVTFLVIDPHIAVNSRTTFEVYFLAIGATCLRYDPRICIVAGVVAAVQYGALVLFTVSHWSLNSAAFAPYPYGYFSWASEVSRLVLLLGATILCTTIVKRSEALRVMSTRDGLTGLYNRTYFTERLREELVRAERYRHSVTVAIIDIDLFKAVNDQWGHHAGDLVLRAVAGCLRDGVRRTDSVARYGGEEFAFLFPETDVDEASQMLDRLREVVRETTVPVLGDGKTVTTTFSGGIASSVSDGATLEELMAHADARLMAAKAAGRDRILTSGMPIERQEVAMPFS
ncbi:MAG: GGDEF domain-containing protein [Gemmatimonadota bacterium]|nr:GGDEF domain-containing protein [Gemmatimonadota bacterium]